MKVYIALFTCVCGIFLFTPSTDAQIIRAESVSIETSPVYPEPFSEMTALIRAHSLDLNGASIAWYANGEEMSECKNTRSCTYRTGERGAAINITALLTLRNGQTKTVRHSVIPARVDVVIEANTNTPAFYKGRTLPSSGSTIRAIALPFTDTPTSQLVYTWELNDRVLYGGPLLGKNIATFEIPFSGSGKISVAVARPGGPIFTKKTIEVPTVDPDIVFYEDNPLRGISRVALPSIYQLTGSEMTVRAEPYFMSADMTSADMRTEWEINGNTVDNPSADPRVITLRSGGGTGSFNVEFHIQNLGTLLQDVRDSFTIRF